MKFFDYFNFLLTKVYADGAGDGGNFSLIKNPLKAQSVQELAEALLTLVYQVGLPLIVIMFIYAGFLYVTAQGDAGKVTRAHNAFLYTVIGAMVVLGAAIIAAVIKGTITKLSA